MKKKWLGMRILVGLCAALGWWGLLYPELVLTPDTVKVSVQDEDGNLVPLEQEWSGEGSLYRELLNADGGQIALRSRLLKDISSFWEAFHDRDRDE